MHLTDNQLQALREDLDLPPTATATDVLKALGPEGRTLLRLAATKPRIETPSRAPTTSRIYSTPPDPYAIALGQRAAAAPQGQGQQPASPSDAALADPFGPSYSRQRPPDAYAVALYRQRQKGGA